MEEQAEIDARVRDHIARFGWHLVLIPPTTEAPGWVHTIGLEERFAHPELIVFGGDFSVLAPLLNALAFRPIAAKWIEPFLGNAAWHYRRDAIPALQCFWPDAMGRFPWQPEFEEALRADQPLLFERETHKALSERMVATLRADGAL